MSARPDTGRDFVKLGGLLVSGVALVIITGTALRAVNRAADAEETDGPLRTASAA